MKYFFVSLLGASLAACSESNEAQQAPVPLASRVPPSYSIPVWEGETFKGCRITYGPCIPGKPPKKLPEPDLPKHHQQYMAVTGRMAAESDSVYGARAQAFFTGDEWKSYWPTLDEPGFSQSLLAKLKSGSYKMVAVPIASSDSTAASYGLHVVPLGTKPDHSVRDAAAGVLLY
jgi:hypothetical protein